MDIAVNVEEISSLTTHQEIDAQSILSVLAGCTPFSDNNQSPRNMYQCQMLKQAMGLFATNMDYRSDNKAYRLQNPQSPITKNDAYNKYDLNDYACGTNGMFTFIFIYIYIYIYKDHYILMKSKLFDQPLRSF